MLKKILLIISLIVLVPIVLAIALFVWAKMAEADSEEAMDYVTRHFQQRHGVEVLNVYDLNEEFPFSYPEIAIEYKLDNQTLKLQNLNIDTFKKHKTFRLSGVNDSFIVCMSSNGYHVRGIDIYNFPDKGYQALKINSVNDLFIKHGLIMTYFGNWPTSSEDGLKIKSSFDGSELSCYRSISSDCD